MRRLLIITALILSGCSVCPPGTATVNGTPVVPMNAPRTGTMAWCRYDPDQASSCTMSPTLGKDGKPQWDCRKFR